MLGVEPVPVVLHLEQVSGRGLFRAYPQLKAQGGQEGAICYSKSEFVGILADWIVQLGDCRASARWTLARGEHAAAGGLPMRDCARKTGNMLEARTVAAWKKAREKLPEFDHFYPDQRGDREEQARILGELPPEVKLWYYHSLFTYNHPRGRCCARIYRMPRRRALEQRVPEAMAFVNFTHPFTWAAFIHTG